MCVVAVSIHSGIMLSCPLTPGRLHSGRTLASSGSVVATSLHSLCTCAKPPTLRDKPRPPLSLSLSPFLRMHFLNYNNSLNIAPFLFDRHVIFHSLGGPSLFNIFNKPVLLEPATLCKGYSEINEYTLSNGGVYLFLEGLSSSSCPQVFYIAEANLNLHFPSAAITGMHYHTFCIQCWGQNPGLHARQASTLSTELQPGPT